MANLSHSEFFPIAFLNESNLNQSLGEEFALCEHGNMVFHWADYFATCDAVKARLESDPEVEVEFKRKEVSLHRLNLIPVWIRTEKKVYQTTMFELYERYILNMMQQTLGIDPFGPIEISFLSGTGPFKSMAIAECFNKTTYRDFVMVYLLKGKLPKRDYRIRLKSKVLMEHGPEFSKASLINLEQLTTTGVLFSVDSDFFLKEMAKEKSVRILMDTNSLKDACSMQLDDLRSHLSRFTFNLMYSSQKSDSFTCDIKEFNAQSSFDFLKNKKVYLFISYDKMAETNGRIKDVQQFVDHTRALVLKHYQTQVTSKIA